MKFGNDPLFSHSVSFSGQGSIYLSCRDYFQALLEKCIIEKTESQHTERRGNRS